MEGTIVAGTELVIAIAWVHAVFGFAGSCVDIAFDWSEDVVNGGKIDSLHSEIVVVIGCVSEAAIAGLSNSWCKFSAEFFDLGRRLIVFLGTGLGSNSRG